MKNKLIGIAIVVLLIILISYLVYKNFKDKKTYKVDLPDANGNNTTVIVKHTESSPPIIASTKKVYVTAKDVPLTLAVAGTKEANPVVNGPVIRKTTSANELAGDFINYVDI